MESEEMEAMSESKLIDSTDAKKLKKPKKKKLLGSKQKDIVKKNSISDTEEAIAERRRLKALKRNQRVSKGKIDKKAIEACQYLNTWENDRSNWKFRKIVQIFLIKNAFDVKRIPQNEFKILLKYFEDMQGNGRKILENEAKRILESDDCQSSKELTKRVGEILRLFEK